MKKISFGSLLIVIMLAGCTVGPSELPPTETAVPLDQLVKEAVSATQSAEDKVPPAFPYSPAELAVLLEPGDHLEGLWTPSSVIDLTRPNQIYTCAGYSGKCYGGFLKYGTHLDLIYEDDKLGRAVFGYFDDPTDAENAFQIYYRQWSENEWAPLNPYQRDPIGEQWLHRLKYVEIEDEDLSSVEEFVWMEVLSVDLFFSRCHSFVQLELRFPTQTTSISQEDPGAERLQEMEEVFNLVYEFAQSIDERITPYACNP